MVEKTAEMEDNKNNNKNFWGDLRLGEDRMSTPSLIKTGSNLAVVFPFITTSQFFTKVGVDELQGICCGSIY